MAQGSGLTAFFSREEAVFRVGGAVVRLRFTGAWDSVDVEGVEALTGRVNFLAGDPDQFRRRECIRSRDPTLVEPRSRVNLRPGMNELHGPSGLAHA